MTISTTTTDWICRITAHIGRIPAQDAGSTPKSLYLVWKKNDSLQQEFDETADIAKRSNAPIPKLSVFLSESKMLNHPSAEKRRLNN
jgi:hypothetical protein